MFPSWGPDPPTSFTSKVLISFVSKDLVNIFYCPGSSLSIYESFATVGEIRVYRRADFQSGSRVLKKVF